MKSPLKTARTAESDIRRPSTILILHRGELRGFRTAPDRRLTVLATAAMMAVTLTMSALGQSADWQNVIWREPQVRYLLADMSLGGNVSLYRDYALREKDPDSRESIRLWDAGVRVVNTNELERRWITNQFGKDGRVMRVVRRGSNRTITGNEVLLSNDGAFSTSALRLVLLDLTLGCQVEAYQKRAKSEPAVAEALRRWAAGCRAQNTNWFVATGKPSQRRLRFAASGLLADGASVVLNSDAAYPEVNARYFLADMYLGGARDFYHRVAESAHEMGCQEAVARYDAGVRIVNLAQLERKQVNGQTLITRKGSDQRINGMEIHLSTD